MIPGEEMPDGCTKCPLHVQRTNIVIMRGGTGPTDILFVGEAPGAEEDRAALPFVGQSGRMLDQWIEQMAFDKNRIRITNICRCRPPNNRVPTEAEREACGKHLIRLIHHLNPKVIVAVGRTADAYLAKRDIAHHFIYHPSYFLRNGGKGWEPHVSRLKRELLVALGKVATIESFDVGSNDPNGDST